MAKHATYANTEQETNLLPVCNIPAVTRFIDRWVLIGRVESNKASFLANGYFLRVSSPPTVASFLILSIFTQSLPTRSGITNWKCCVQAKQTHVKFYHFSQSWTLKVLFTGVWRRVVWYATQKFCIHFFVIFFLILFSRPPRLVLLLMLHFILILPHALNPFTLSLTFDLSPHVRLVAVYLLHTVFTCKLGGPF